MKTEFKFGISTSTEQLSPTSPVVFRGDIFENIRKTKEAGYDGVELQFYCPENLDPNAIWEYCKELGIKVAAVSTGLEYLLGGYNMIDDDPARREATREKMFNYIKVAGLFQCPVIIGCIRGNIPQTEAPEIYWNRFREEMCLLSDEASKYGVTLVIEAINFYVNNYLTSVRQTCDFVDSLGRDNVKVHIDTHHMAIEDANMVETVRYAGNRIGYVHFSENNRFYPGAGGVDFWGVMKTLKEIGYDGFITLEIIPAPDPETCAKRGLEYLKKIGELLESHPYLRA